MPLQATSGAASYDGFGGGVVAEPNYIESCFSTYLYTGNATARSIDNGIDLSTKGGLVWIKNRTFAGSDHQLFDTARGATKRLFSNLTDAEVTTAGTLTSFDTTGFSLGTQSSVNFNTYPQVSWTFRKQPKFFDVVTWTGNDVIGREIPHNLGSVPGCIMVKQTNATRAWVVYHVGIGNTKYLTLNSTSPAGTQSFFNNTTPTSTVFTVGDWGAVNGGGNTYVAYLFAHNAGGFGLTGTDNVISCGTFTIDGSGKFTANIGYEPQWIMIKRTNGTSNWSIFDNMRGMPVGSPTTRLLPNLSDAESSAFSFVDINATGFAAGTGSGNPYGTDDTFIYIAIRRGPMKVPTSGTSVFYPNAYSGTGADTTITSTGFPPDLFFSKARSFSSTFLNVMVDRLRGASQFLVPSNIIGETEGTNVVLSLNMNGVTLGSSSNANSGTVTYAQWNFRRAPSCFDIVCYSGTGSTLTVDHNLQATPELIIIKRRNGDSSTGWVVYESNLGFNKYMILNQVGSDTLQYLTATSSTTFTLNSGGYTDTNSSGNTYVAYLFATCAGVSKVFSYTGNGSSQTINCGFTGGARFVLIKRTDVSSGNWFVWDTARGIVSGNDPYLSLNTTAVEVTSDDSIDTNSTGFVVNQVSATNVNVSSATYIGLAIA